MSKTSMEPATDSATTGIGRFLPIVEWLPLYNRSWLRGDLIAGLSVWALMVPTSLGYASISGVPVQYGLYAAAAGLIAMALFSTSKQATEGPSSTTAAVLGAAVLATAAQDSPEAIERAAAIVLVAGAIYVVMRLLRMGWVSDFLSASVLTGFTFGVALNVISGELFKITGTEKTGDNTWEKLWNWLTSLDEANAATVIVGVAALVLVFGLALFTRRLPAALIVVASGIAVAGVLNLEERGVAFIQEVPGGLPGLVVPDLSYILENWDTIFPGALALVIIGFSVTTATVRRYAAEHEYRINLNQELLAQGMANAFSSLFQGVYNNGSLSKSPVNDQAGAKSQLSNLFQAVFIILTLVFLAPLFSHLPEAVLGAIIIEAVAMGMIDIPEMRRLFRASRFEFGVALAALLGVMTFGVMWGVLIGVVLSLLWLVAVSSRPHIPELGRKPGTEAFFDIEAHSDAQEIEGVAIIRFDGGLFFVNTGALSDRLRTITVRKGSDLRGFVLSMEGVDFIDVQGADTITKLIRAGHARDVDVRLARVKGPVVERLERTGTLALLGTDHIHASNEEAVRAHLAQRSRRTSASTEEEPA